MRNRIYRAILIWRDGEIEDADEITVFAADPDEAVSAARRQWRLTIGAAWPHCRIVDTKIFPTKQTAGGCHT